MEALKDLYDLYGIARRSTNSTPTQLPQAGLQASFDTLLSRLEASEKTPYDQGLLEDKWAAVDQVIKCIDEPQKPLYRLWGSPAEPTLAEMAFCRVVDGWKFYLEELSQRNYGEGHDAKLSGDEEKTLDHVLNVTRNLFVHNGGVLGTRNTAKPRKHLDIYKSKLGLLNASTSPIVDLCHHALGLKERDRLQLGMQETKNYLCAISELFETIEQRQV